LIAGIFKRKESDLDLKGLSDLVLGAVNSSGRADLSGVWANGSVVFCSALRFNTPESKWEKVPFVSGDGIIVVFWGRLTNRKDLGESLGIRDSLDRVPDTELIYLSRQKWSNDFIHHLYGDFSLAIYDPGQRELVCCTDHMGCRPLYYYIDNDIFIFASSLTVFHRLNIVPVEPDMAWAARYILHLSMDFETTAYSDIFKLPPAHMLCIRQDVYRKEQYFSFNGEYRLAGVSMEACIEHYRALLDDAVKSRVSTNYSLGSETSGGIDSSTVTALSAGYFTGHLDDLHTFGYALLDDEPGLILQTSQKYKLANNHIYCAAPEISQEVIDRSLDVMGYPCEHGNAIYHYPFYQECEKKGIRTLLSGFGGDEFVTTIHGNIIVSELIRDKKYSEVYPTLRGNKLTAFLRLLKLFYKQKFTPPEEYCPRFLAAWKKRWPHHPLRRELVEAYSLEKAYFDTAKFDAGYTDLNQFTLEQRFAPFVPTRMNNCIQMAHSYGIDYAWPLLDVRLIAYFLSVPTEYKLGRVGRYFHRRAMDGIVPDSVNWKPSKNMGGFSFHPMELKEIPDLNPDLHPDLLHFIEPDKIRKKREAFFRVKDMGKVFFRRYIVQINHMDLWLKKFHARGANWKNGI